MQYIIELKDLDQLISESDIPVLLQFSSHTCPRCGPFTTYITELSRDFTFQHIVVAVTNAPTIVQQYNVTKLPAFVILSSEGEGAVF